MNSRFTYISCCLLLIGSCFTFSCTTEVVPKGLACNKVYTDINRDHPMATGYQQALDHFRRQNTIPGAVLLAHHPTKGMWMGSSGYADLQHQTPMQLCDQFRVASISKTLIGTVVLQMQQEGRYELSTTLAELMPELSGKIPNAGHITVRHLLNHTSGIHDYQEDLTYRLDMFNKPKKTTAKTSKELLEDYVYGKRADFKPGEKWRYSNSNFNILELIIEKLESKTVQQILSERLFTPLGMDGYFEVRQDEHLVRGYRDLYENGTLINTSVWDPTDDGQGDGGFIGTAHDLFLFSQALFSGKLLQPHTMAAMQTIDVPDSDYGLALQRWQIGQVTAWGHGGQAYGFHSWMLYFPKEQVQVVLLVNLSNRPSKESFETLVTELIK